MCSRGSCSTSLSGLHKYIYEPLTVHGFSHTDIIGHKHGDSEPESWTSEHLTELLQDEPKLKSERST